MVDDTLVEMAQKYGIRRTAEKLGYTYSYVYQVLNGKFPMSRKLRNRLRRMKPHAPTVTTRYEPADPRRERALTLTMEERRAALDRAYHKKLMQ